MDLASIYLYETNFDENNKFTLEFLTKESDFNVFFSKNTTYYLTNLDVNLILDKESNEIEIETYHNNVKKLSEISNKLIEKSFNDNTKFNFVHLSWFDSNLYKYDLYLNDNLIDLMSYKYKFLDVKKNKIIDSKIYDPYSHLKFGIEFEFDKEIRGKSTYKIQLVKNKLIKTLNFQMKDFTLDFWYKYVNFIGLLNINTKKFLMKFPRYELVDYVYKKLNIPVEAKDIIELYYRYIDREGEIICHEDNYSKLSADKKANVAFLILKNKKMKVFKNKIIYVPRKNYREKTFNSFADILISQGSKKNFFDVIKAKEPLFPFEYIEEFSTGFYFDITIELNKHDVLYKNDLNYNPFLHISCPNSDIARYFRTSTGIVNKREVITLSTEEENKLKKLMSKDVDEIKELLEKEEVEKSLKPTTEEIQQRHFYLYDNSNLVKPTLITEINKKISIYGKIEIAAVNDTNKNKLISPDKALKFEIEKNIFKENLSFELQNITKEKIIKTIDSKVHNINVIMIPQNRKKYTLVDSIKIIGFHSFGIDKLNPISISIENNELISHLSINKNYKYRLTVNSVLLSSSIKNETEIIHLSAIGLTDARYSLINNKLLKSLGQINLTEVENFEFFKQKKGWINCILTDSYKIPYSTKHFSYSFITNNLLNILNFEVEFLNKKGERLEWTAGENKIPNITFTVDILL